MNIFRFEFKNNIRSMLMWGLALSALVSIYLSVFASIFPELSVFMNYLENFPKEIVIAFGLDGLQMKDILGYFSFAFMLVQLGICIQAANYGIGLVSIEERDMTADFLLTKPVSRVKILTIKVLAALSSLLVTLAMVSVVTVIMVELNKGPEGYSHRSLGLLLFGLLMLQLFFFSLGLLVSLLLRKVRSVPPIAMSLVLGLYLLNAFGTSEDNLSVFAYITPFRHFEANAIIRLSRIEPSLLLTSVAVIVVCMLASYILYLRRDIHSV